MKLFKFYITRTDWRSAYNNAIKAMDAPKSDLSLIYKGDKYYQDDANNWRCSKTGRYVSPKDVMTEQLKRDVYREIIGNYDDIKKASKIEGFGR